MRKPFTVLALTLVSVVAFSACEAADTPAAERTDAPTNSVPALSAKAAKVHEKAVAEAALWCKVREGMDLARAEEIMGKARRGAGPDARIWTHGPGYQYGVRLGADNTIIGYSAGYPNNLSYEDKVAFSCGR